MTDAAPMPPAAQPDRDATIAVRLLGPLDLPASLEGARRWGDDLLERWDGHVLMRTARVAGQPVAYAAEVTGSLDEPSLRLTVEPAAQTAIAAPSVDGTLVPDGQPPAASTRLEAVARAVGGMFVQSPAALATLALEDPAIAVAHARYPGVRPLLQHDLFTALVRAISSQQITLQFANTLRRRLAEAYGTPHQVAGRTVYSLDPVRIAALSPDDLRALQFSNAKAQYVLEAARAIAGGGLSLDELRDLPDDEVISRATALHGIGRWTAEWLLARTLGRPRVVAGDLGVRKAVGRAYLAGRMPSEAEVRQLTAHWGAAATVAQQLLLHDLTFGGA